MQQNGNGTRTRQSLQPCSLKLARQYLIGLLKTNGNFEPKMEIMTAVFQYVQ